MGRALGLNIEIQKLVDAPMLADSKEADFAVVQRVDVGRKLAVLGKGHAAAGFETEVDSLEDGPLAIYQKAGKAVENR